MKIVFLNRYFHPDHSATSQILSDLAFHLAARGHDVRVITSRQRYDDAGASLSARELIAWVSVHRVWTTRFGRGNLLGRAFDYLTFYIAALWCLLRLLRRGDVVVAKTDPPLISVVAALAARIKGAQLVNWLQDIFPEVGQVLGVRMLRGPLGRIAKAARNASLRQARANVVLGERMAARVRALGVDGDRIETIPNWADDEVLRPLSHEENPLRREWGLPGRFVVAYSGNLGRAHEFDTMLEAARILGQRANVVFLFIGAGAQRDAVQGAAAARGLSNVLFQPYQAREQLRFSLGVADLHVISLVPALEGLIVPSKFYGIAAAGRPIAFIGAGDGEIGALARRHDCGRCFDVGDAAGLAGFVLELLKNNNECRRLGDNARLALEAEWSRAAALQRWEGLLTRIL